MVPLRSTATHAGALRTVQENDGRIRLLRVDTGGACCYIARSISKEQHVANTKSAEKRNRQAQKRRERNTGVRSTVKTAVKKAREAIAKKDPAAAKAALLIATSTIDKAATKGVLHARAASRKIARLSRSVAQLGK
jgi:small subunit ribosomal protein S20